MRDAGRITAAIEVLDDIEQNRKPAKVSLQWWAGRARYAGAKDRAWISGLVLDVLRHRRSLSWRIGVDSPRARILAGLRYAWGWPIERIAVAVAEPPHGPGLLTDDEHAGLQQARALDDAPAAVAGDYPDWMEPYLDRAFGEARVAELQALAARAPIDLRINTLKTDVETASKPLVSVRAEAAGLLDTAFRIPAPAPSERGAPVETIPAYSKGWVEVQDLGSQIAACAAGEIVGRRVLDLCAGGGGKTLALAALMKGQGRIYAYDVDARRLAPTFRRAERAGVSNLDVRSPAAGEGLDDLEGQMDVVFVDAPCTGSGVWRRQPDSKWRLSESQFEKRKEQQEDALAQAARYVRPGGRLVYVTCSLFLEENEDRLGDFRRSHKGFAPASALSAIRASGLLTARGHEALKACAAADGALRLTPKRTGTDGFFIAVLKRAED